MVREISTQEDFDQALKDAGAKLVVVDFFATWCGPCKVIAPVIKEWSEGDYKDVIFLKVDVDQAAEVAEKYNVQAMPTFLFFKSGEKIHEVVGASQPKLLEGLNKHK